MKSPIFIIGILFFFFPGLIFAETEPFDMAKKRLLNLGILTQEQAKNYASGSTVRRDDFSSIVLGIGCNNCRNPSPAEIMSYSLSPFPDVLVTNSNYFCITDGATNQIIQGYRGDSNSTEFVCTDGTRVKGNQAYCPGNAITRIEALAIFLRQAQIWDDSRKWEGGSEKVNDVSSFWKGYAETAVRLKYVEAPEGKFRPDEPITFHDFTLLASKILSITSCELQNSSLSQNASNAIGSHIALYEPGTNCTKLLTPESARNKEVDVGLVLSPKQEISSVKWQYRSIPEEDSITTKNAGMCLSGLKTDGNGTTIVQAQSSVSSSQVPIEATTTFARNSPDGSQSNALLWFDVSPLSGEGPLNTTFTLKSQFPSGNTSASYFFGEGEGSGTGLNVQHTYKNPGNYQSVSTAISGNRSIRTSALIGVFQKADSDDDGVLDSSDDCPFVFGIPKNLGCPVFQEFSQALPVRLGKEGSDTLTGGISGLPKFGFMDSFFPGYVDCLLSQQARKSIIIAQGFCTACPCVSPLRESRSIQVCDTLIPAVAPTPIDIFQLGSPFQFR